jgi:tRNA pseudouridine55 synthase
MLGFINAFKPPGMTSTAFGSFVRRLVAGAPVGHWGTLDPRACGVLVLAVGNATRLLPLIAPSNKQYVFDIHFGIATDTADASGNVIARGELPADWKERLPSIASDLVGALEQVPPMFSAVKVGGRPLYVSARKGGEVARLARTIRVSALRVISTQENAARLSVECEAGLYVRTLCEEIGKRLEVPAHMGALVRTTAGPFAIAQSHLPDEIAADPSHCLIDPLAVLTQPRIELDDASAKRFTHGNAVALNGAPYHANEHLVLQAGQLIGTGRLANEHGKNTLNPTRVFTQA